MCILRNCRQDARPKVEGKNTDPLEYMHPKKLDVCTLLYHVTYLTPPSSLCTLLTPNKTGNHQSHFNTHGSPSSQDERLPMIPLLTGQHVIS